MKPASVQEPAAEYTQLYNQGQKKSRSHNQYKSIWYILRYNAIQLEVIRICKQTLREYKHQHTNGCDAIFLFLIRKNGSE